MELVIIRTFDNYINAHLTLSKLQANGIECFLEDELSSTIMTNAIAVIKLSVKKIDLENAIEVLKKIDTEYLEAAVCSNCDQAGLIYISRVKEKNFASTLLSWFFKGLPSSLEQVYHCNNCGWESEKLPAIHSNYNNENMEDIELE